MENLPKNTSIYDIGLSTCNSNGFLLLRTCATYGLVITNTIFRLPTRNKTSWMHPRSKFWYLIGYIIARTRDRQNVQVSKTVCGAECWTDHRLIISNTKLHIQPMRRLQGKKVAKQLNFSKLKLSGVKGELVNTFEHRLTEATNND